MLRKKGWYAVAILASVWAAVTWVAVTEGQASLHLFLVFPVLSASGAWGFAAILLGFLTFAAFMIVLAGFNPLEDGVDKPKGARPSAGGVVIIGPLPIVFGTDRRMALMAIVLALAALAVTALLLLL